MNPVPPHSATVSKFSTLAYALSAETSPMAKLLAVSLTSGTNCGQSPESLSSTRTAVTTFVLTPEHRWTLTHWQRFRVTPYLWSNQRSNLDVLNPLLSMAKSVSTDRSGRLLQTISCLRTGA